MTEEKKEKKKKVAIVGFAGTRDQAPYDDPTFEIWTVNNLYRFVPRQDRIFQIHTKAEIFADGQHRTPEDKQMGAEHWEYLTQTDIPVYMQEKFPEIPAAVRYPIEEIIEEFGIPRTNETLKDAYFTNSISFMIALAIHEGFEEIHVYGVDMAVGGEYTEQRPSCEYYLGIAKGRGIKIYLPPESDLLKAHFMYGWEDEKRSAWDMKLQKTIQMMKANKLNSDQIIRNQQSVSDKYEGAIVALLEMDRTWGQ
jgi:hypothetical protein